MDFVKLCIYHTDNPVTGTFRGLVDISKKVFTSGKINFICDNFSNIKYRNFDIYQNFYAFSSNMSPIPSGLKMITVHNLQNYPYGTKKITYSYDVFDKQENTISFITWTQPVDGTVPLYLHRSPEGYSYPSFDKFPPNKVKGWKEDIVSPIYVLVDYNTHSSKLDSNLHELPKWKMKSNGFPDFKFIKSDNRCIPSINGMSIQECFFKTDKKLLQNPALRSGPMSLLEYIRQLRKIEKNRFDNKLLFYGIIILISIFGILYINVRKMNNKNNFLNYF